MKVKILAFGDMHDRTDLLNMAIGIENPDIILSCGDNDVYEDMGKPYIGVYGNHETQIAEAIMNGSVKFRNVKLLKPGEIIKLKDIKISGFPGNHAKEKKEWHHYTKSEAEKALKKMSPSQGINIFITHEAPLNMADWNVDHTKHFGCPHIRRMVDKIRPRLALSGHIHSPQIRVNGYTTAINVGKLALGQYFIISMDTEGFLIQGAEQRQLPVEMGV